MELPNRTFEAGIARLEWEQFGISIKINRLREDSSGVLSGEILVMATTGHLHQARFNLTSTTARVALARLLRERIESLDWQAILEIACVYTLQAYRKGEDTVELDTVDTEKAVRYRIEPLLFEREPNIIYGPGGTGKTYLAIFLANLVSIPVVEWPKEKPHVLNCQPGPVLYLDYETTKEELARRRKETCLGLGFPKGGFIYYRRCHQRLVDDVETIQAIVIEKDIEVIFVDSLGSACGGEPEEAKNIIPYFNALRAIGKTSLTLHHTNREGKLFGSAYIFNQSRNVWELVRSQMEDSATIDLALHHRKVNSGRLRKPLGLGLDFSEPGKVVVSVASVMDNPVLAAGASLRAQLYNELKRGASTVAELALALNKTQNAVKARLNEHKEVFVTFDRPLASGGTEKVWALRLPTT